MVKVGKRIVERVSPIEDMCQLVSMLKINLTGTVIGGYILQKGQNNFKIVFGFDCQGVHQMLRSEEIDPIFDSIESGLKDLPPNENLTINLGSFTSDKSRQLELKTVFDKVSSNELRYLLMAERTRVQQLTQLGIRKPKYLRLYATFTVEPDTQGVSDVVEKFLAKGERLWKRFTGELDELEFLALEQLIYGAFTDGFQLWEQLLSNKMGLSVRAFSDWELWEQLWQRFNKTPARQIPQLLILDEKGRLREEVFSEFHPITVLMESESSVPVADRHWVFVKDKYVGVLSFLEKPGGWGNKFQELRYLWAVLAKDLIFDTEIICQVSRANEALIKTNMQRLMKQSMTATQISADKNSMDVKAMLNIRKSVAAQEAIYEGEVPVYVAVAFLVYRSDRDKLGDACRYLQSLFLPPAWILREAEYPWLLWLQCLPVIWDRLLAVPFNRRQLYLSGEAPGLMPLMQTRPADKGGFELISEEGGTPVHLDLYNQHRNVGLFGTTRSGKSVLAAGLVTQALAYGLPVVVMDYPKPDGSSTFSDYTEFLKHEGAYFDIGRESSNLFEIPNLKGLPEKVQNERFQDYIDFLRTALLGMVLGTRIGEKADPTQTDTIRSVLGLAIKAFFEDVQLRDRYAQAYKKGLGTTEWLNMPTLSDFIGYCSAERLCLESIPGDTKSAISRIKLRLRFWESSRVGKALGSPSTFRSDSQLLVFALRNLSNDEDAAIIALATYSAALRRALATPASIFFIDESPILFEYDAISNLIGRLCANGAKAGIRVLLSAQDPDTIAKSPAGAKIFQNLNTRLVGRIQPTAVDSFCDILKYPRNIIGRNATETFFPKKEGFYSQWLLDNGGIFTICRYYPPLELLAVVANNPDEQKARTAAMANKSDKLRALTDFSRQLASLK